MILLGKIVGWLLTPVTLLVLLTLLTFSKRRLPTFGFWLKMTVAGWIFFTNPMFVNVIFRWWEGRPEPLESLKEPYEAAILLTGFLETPEVTDRPFLGEDGDRLMQALNLYRAGKVKRILISGGKVFQSDVPSEPDLVRPWLLQQGVPDFCIWVENLSRNTYQSASAVWTLLGEIPGAQSKSYLLVTSAYHMRRSATMFQKTPLKFRCWPAGFQSLKLTWHPTKWLIPSPLALNMWHLLFKEWIGMAVYSLKS